MTVCNFARIVSSCPSSAWARAFSKLCFEFASLLDVRSRRSRASRNCGPKQSLGPRDNREQTKSLVRCDFHDAGHARCGVPFDVAVEEPVARVVGLPEENQAAAGRDVDRVLARRVDEVQT